MSKDAVWKDFFRCTVSKSNSDLTSENCSFSQGRSGDEGPAGIHGPPVSYHHDTSLFILFFFCILMGLKWGFVRRKIVCTDFCCLLLPKVKKWKAAVMLQTRLESKNISSSSQPFHMLYAPFDQHNEEQTHHTTTDSRADPIMTVEQTESVFLVELTRGSRGFDHPVYMCFVYFIKAGDHLPLCMLEGGLGDYRVPRQKS